MNSVLVGINLRVHEIVNHHEPYSFDEMFSDLKQFIMRQACPEDQPAAGSSYPEDKMAPMGLPAYDSLSRGEE